MWDLPPRFRRKLPRRSKASRLVETLEGRLLLTGAVAEYPLSAPLTGFYNGTPAQPNGPLTYGPDGNFWFTEGLDTVARVSPTGTLAEFKTGGGYVFGPLTDAPDGNLWFGESDLGAIARVTTSGVITVFRLPATSGSPGPVTSPSPLTVGPDGNLWFPEYRGNVNSESGVAKDSDVARITTSGALSEFPLPAGSGFPFPLTVGSDGNLWFIESSGSIGRVTPSGVVTNFPAPSPGSYQSLAPRSLTLGSDGNLWFFAGSNDVGRITPAGVVTTFPLPSDATVTPSNLSSAITLGPDGNLWFPVNGVNGSDAGVARLTTAGNITVFRPSGIPAGYFNSTESVTDGPDGNLYFLESVFMVHFEPGIGPVETNGSTRIDQVSPSGTIVTLPHLRGYAATPLTPGPGGNPSLLEATANGSYLIATVNPANINLNAVDVLGLPVTEDFVTAPQTTYGRFIASTATASASGFQATIQFGDGQSAPGVITVEAPGVFDVSAAHAYPRPGTYTTTITITSPDQTTYQGSGSMVVTVPRPQLNTPQVTALAGIASTATYATFASPFPGATAADFVATVQFGDGSKAYANVIAGPGGLFEIQAPHAYAKAGTYTFTAAVDGPFAPLGPAGPYASVVTATGRSVVVSASPVVSVSPVSTTAGVAATTILAIFRASYPGASPADFHALVAFGDGLTAPGVITVAPNGLFEVSATHTYASAGRYRLTVTVTGPGGSQGSSSALAVVAPLPAVVSWRRTGFGNQPTRLVLTFNRAMNAATVQDLRNYLLYQVGPNGFPGNRLQPIPIASAVYDPTHQTLTLTTRPRLTLGGYYLLTVSGLGTHPVVDVNGDPLTGTGTSGKPGDYIAMIHGYGPSVSATSAAQVVKSKAVPAGPRSQAILAARH